MDLEQLKALAEEMRTIYRTSITLDEWLSGEGEKQLNDFSQYEDEATPMPTTEELAEVGKLAERMLKQQEYVEKVEAHLKRAKEALRQTQQIDLPELMASVGLSMFKTADGRVLEVENKLHAEVPKDNRPLVAKWLIKHKHGALVKSAVVVPFDKGDQGGVRALVDMLEQAGIDTYSVNETVNTGSLKALIKELTAEGVDVPLKLMGAHFVTKAVVK